MFNVRKIEYKGLTEYRIYDKPVIQGKAPDNTGIRGQGSERSFKESIRRTRQKIVDLALSNSWDWFLTWTFDPQKVDSLNYQACVDKLSVWLNNSRRKAKDLAYIIVPELHKSRRFHFHGLARGMDNLGLKDSGKRDKKGRPIFNVGSYPWGWTTATRIEDPLKAGGYILKYITKDIVAVTQNKRRYWASRNLNKPIVNSYLLTHEDQEKLQMALKEKASWAKEVKLEKNGYSNVITYFQLVQA